MYFNQHAYILNMSLLQNSVSVYLDTFPSRSIFASLGCFHCPQHEVKWKGFMKKGFNSHEAASSTFEQKKAFRKHPPTADVCFLKLSSGPAL